jgi:hypothetical protein
MPDKKMDLSLVARIKVSDKLWPHIRCPRGLWRMCCNRLVSGIGSSNAAGCNVVRLLCCCALSR